MNGISRLVGVLAEKPGWMEQDEYEERTSVVIGRFAKNIGGMAPRAFVCPAWQNDGDE